MYQHRRGPLTYIRDQSGSASRERHDRYGRFITVSTDPEGDYAYTPYGRHNQARAYHSLDGLDEFCYTERR